MEINVDIIKELIGSLGASTFDALRLETDDFKLTIERNVRSDGSAKASPVSSAVDVNSVAVASPETEAALKQQKDLVCCKGTVVKSPIVGTFYVASSPDKPAFVKVGQHVKIGDTLYIVESMKLMNEIESECDGTVAEIYTQSGQAVEYGQPIMRIE